MTISEAIVADFKPEIDHTRHVLEAVPEDKFDWKPHDKSMSLGQLAGHIAETPTWLHAMLEDEMDFATAMADWKPFIPSNGKELVETFGKNAADFTGRLAGCDDACMQGTWTAKMGDKVMMQEKRKDVIRTICIHHMIHHRGQLTVYLRLLGAKIPQTYGPTADYPDM